MNTEARGEHSGALPERCIRVMGKSFITRRSNGCGSGVFRATSIPVDEALAGRVISRTSATMALKAVAGRGIEYSSCSLLYGLRSFQGVYYFRLLGPVRAEYSRDSMGTNVQVYQAN